MSKCQEMNVHDAHARLNAGNCAVADIRDAQSYQQGHIAGAVNINNDNLADFINANTDKSVLVVCYHGVSSQRAAQYMLEQGVGEAFNLSGGMAAWSEAHGDKLIVGTNTGSNKA